MSKTKITAPIKGYNGTVSGVEFVDGVAETDDPAVISYCGGAGYGIGSHKPVTEPEPEIADPRDVSDEQVGTSLRDAAVDPKPQDYLPPSNAGEANPHGPKVISPELHSEAVPSVQLDTEPAPKKRKGK